MKKSEKREQKLPRLVLILTLVGLLLSSALVALPVAAEDQNNSEEAVSYFSALRQLSEAFTGSSHIKFTQAAADAPRFVDNSLDDDFEEKPFPSIMGRVVVPAIGMDSPLFPYSLAFESVLAWGSGIVPLSKGETSDYIDSIYIHRVLSVTTGGFYMDELKEGDSFYVDNFRTGLRYFYKIDHVDFVTREEYYERHPYYGSDYEYGPMLGKEILLVTCDPLIYAMETNRILVYASTSEDMVRQLPEDDPYYQRYREVNGLD
jgi:LPXTG-site transpeptidase (sortase) family protein